MAAPANASSVAIGFSAGMGVSSRDLDLSAGRGTMCPDIPIPMMLAPQDLAAPFKEANVAAARLLGYEFLHDLMLISPGDIYVDPKVHDEIASELWMHRLASTTRECQLLRKDGTPIWVSIRAKAERRRGDGELGDITFVIVDISEKKRLQDELNESEERFLAIFTHSAQGILLADPKTKKLHCGNPRMAAMLGYSPAEISKLAVADIHPPDAMPEVSRHFEALARQEVQFSRNVPIRRRDGSIFYADINVAYVKLKGKLYAAGFFHDITARKQAEEESRGYQERLRSLALQLSLAEEQERRRLAGHLHDEVGQLLSLAQIRLMLVQPTLTNENCRKAATEMQTLLERALQSTRSLTFQMSHPALYDLGFVAGAEWLAEDVSKLYGIQVDLSEDDQPKPMDLRIRVVLFQCLRELLVNAAKYARVKTVKVHIARKEQMVQVIVSDQGVGLDPKKLNEHPANSGFGLFSIRERLRSLGGNFEIDSGPERGTTATLGVPI